jgi:CelD/BcsL family acetyltransferase involved in cellulose biosynthesis
VKLELITTQEQFNALGEQWNSLLTHNATNEIFLTWEWQHTWWSVYQPGDLWVIAGYKGDQLVAIAPYFLERDTRIVRTIGCVEVTDYLDVIVMAEHRESFFSALVDLFIEHAADYSVIDLCNIPDGTPTLELLPRYLNERGFAVVVKDEDVCPFIPLPASFDAYIESLDKKNRHELRRKLRRAEVDDEDEKVDWYIVGPEHDLTAETEKFLTLMAASREDKAEFLTKSRHKEFFKTIIPVLAQKGWLQLSFLTVNGEAAATYFNFDYANRILVYNSGLLPESYAHLSPGVVLLAYNIKHAIELGRTEFDFLQGNEDYKYRMGGRDRAVKMIEANRQPVTQNA